MPKARKLTPEEQAKLDAERRRLIKAALEKAEPGTAERRDALIRRVLNTPKAKD
jgi:uncharacterized protein Smg (DUF494 family)